MEENITQPPSPPPPPPSEEENDIDDPELDAKMRLYPEDFGLAPRRPPKTFGYEWHEGVVSPFVVSRDKMVTAVLDYLEGEAIGASALSGDGATPAATDSSNIVVMDIGCGEGTFLIEAAKRFKCQCFGIDIDKSLCKRAQEKAAAAGVGHLVHTFEGDLRELLSSSNKEGEGNAAAAASCLSDSASAAPVVTMRTALAHTTIFYFYLLPAVLDKLIEPWLMQQLERTPGLTCIFNTWAPASKELKERFLAPPRDRALHAKRGFYVYQSIGR